MDRIIEIKNKVRISEWSEMVRACHGNGLTVQQWCNSNGINIKDILLPATKGKRGSL